MMFEESHSPILDTAQQKNSTLKEEDSTSSHPDKNPEDEISDHDDDDRNHKHRRREAKSSPDTDVPQNLESHIRPNRKRFRPENGRVLIGSNPDAYAQSIPKFEKRRTGMAHFNRNTFDSFQRTRTNQSFHADLLPHVDFVGSSWPSIGCGRGRNAPSWNQHDARLNSVDIVDFAPPMASQVPPVRPGFFSGVNLTGTANAKVGSWGPYGFLPGIRNGIIDPIHPLGIQGTLNPAISPLLDLGLPRQRCRDFDERGFCLRGDMCPMEHGMNRIVVEDIQSLSQFNLPVSIPNQQHNGAIQSDTGLVLPVNASISTLAVHKVALTKERKSGADHALDRTACLTSTATTDVYDPDQPLWNNNLPETSYTALHLPSDTDQKPLTAGSIGNASQTESLNHGVVVDVGTSCTNPSVCARIKAPNNSEKGKTSNRILASKITSKNNLVAYLDANLGMKEVSSASIKILAPNALCRNGGSPAKATRTLYVFGIPQQSNKKEVLFAHFQKFGEIIDIYIPSNSEKAFVQFSKKDEADAAIRSPDAVMGNRFIKVLWANRDRIPEEVDGNIPLKASPNNSISVGSAAHTLLQGTVRGKVNLSSSTPKGRSGYSVDMSYTSALSNGLSASGVKAVPPVHKKQENSELLEEIRKKQESLAQKREEFRRQLEKLAKQASYVKKVGDAGTGQKVDPPNDASTNITPRSSDLVKREGHEVALCDSPLIPRASSINAQQSVSPSDQSTSLSPSGRTKLNNHAMSFRILPPVPSEIADVSILKDHFSTFGNLSSVIFDKAKTSGQDSIAGKSLSVSAIVTYTTHQSAERAYVSGRSCKGHHLKFLWLNDGGSGLQEIFPSPAILSLESETMEEGSYLVGTAGSLVKSSSFPLEECVMSNIRMGASKSNAEFME